MEYNKLPAGCYFNPTNKDLVKFLTEKVKYDRLPPYIVPQKLYGEKATEPWKFFRGKVETQVYFFTSLGRKTPNGSKFERTTGHGTWKGQANIEITEKPKSDKVIGNKKNYRFELMKGLDYSITGCLHPWRFVMHEYSLPGNELDVICKITRYPPQKSSREVEELLEEEAQVVIEQPNTNDHQGHRPLEPSQNTNRNKRSRVVRRPSSNGGGANNEIMGSELRTEQVQSVPSSVVGNPVQQSDHHQVKEEHQVVYNNYPNLLEMMQLNHAVFGISSLDAQTFNLVNESLLFTSQGDDSMNGLISSFQDLSQPHISTAPPMVDDSLLQPLPPQLGNLTVSLGNTISNAMPSSLWSSSLSAAHYVMRGSASAASSDYNLPLLSPLSLPGEVVIPPHEGDDGANLSPTK